MPNATRWPDSPRCPTVLLKHTLPDGSFHYDWLLAREPRGDSPLLSFRLHTRLDHATTGDIVAAEQIDDHRSAYLDYEGDVSHGRGHVVRLAKGLVTMDVSGDAVAMLVDWGESPLMQRLVLTSAVGSAEWCIEIIVDEGDAERPGTRS